MENAVAGHAEIFENEKEKSLIRSRHGWRRPANC